MWRIKLARFRDTNYWYFVVECINGPLKSLETLRVLVRLNGIAVKPI